MKKKPGSIGYVVTDVEEVDVPNPWTGGTMKAPKERFKEFIQSGNEGWQSHYNRNKNGGFDSLFVKEWDNWDRVLLRNSKSRIKKIFKAYYSSRDFTPGDNPAGPYAAGNLFIKNLKARIVPSPGRGLLTWGKRRKLRSNPYSADGKLCKKND